MAALAITCTATADALRPVWRRDFAVNVALGGLYSPVAKRHTAAFLARHTLVDGTPLQAVPVRKSPWPALLLVALFLALRVAGEFGRGPPLPVVIVAGVLLVPYLWGTVTARSVASVRWRDRQPRFTASWREVYAASWPLLLLGLAWAVAEPAVARAAARADGELDAAWIAGVAAAAAVSFPLLVRLGFEWQRLRLHRTEVAGRTPAWPATYGACLRIWSATAAAIAVVAVLPVLLLRYLLLGSATVAGLGAGPAAAVTLAGLVAVLLLSAPLRARHEARMFVLAWDGLRLDGLARVRCDLDVRAFAALRTRQLWRSLATGGRARPQAVVDAYRAKLASLHVDADV